MKTIKIRNLLIVAGVAAFGFVTNALAQQDAAKATENAIQTTDKIENLRVQITEIETKKSNLQERIRQLDEAMLPQNLEQTTVIAGSTRPEELRENRRRQLEAEKKAAQSQIELLDQSRSRIELSIAATQPKPVSTETPLDNAPKTDAAAQTENQNTVVAEIKPVEKTPVKSAKRYPAKRKRIVKNKQ